jgi:hypothetical protein
MKTLYKYKSLNHSLKDYEYLEDIIKNNRLYAATYEELQDIDNNEGRYNIYDIDNFSRDFLDKIKNTKLRLGICSLSNSVTNEELWAKYADNHGGIIIEVEIDTDKYKILPVKYGEKYTLEREADNATLQIATDILTHKTAEWKDEKEERAFVVNTDWQAQEAGPYVKVRITQIITGREITEKNYSCLKTLIDECKKSISLIDEEAFTHDRHI